MFYSRNERLFWQLYRCGNESDVDKLIASQKAVFAPANWHPLGDNFSNFSIVENQQSNPVAALVEKLTNSIDAILMRRCAEADIDPESPLAPRTMGEAVSRFFPAHKNWDMRDPRSEQARSIQVLADGSRSDTSIVIYDDGEGQHPKDFEATFLSLVQGNKQKIHFVQGKYNMGGTGALVFCGKRRYQLIASRRFDGSGGFGFTLIREHPLSAGEAAEVKNTWYEYLKIDGEIPAFDIDEMDLGLHRRVFRTGTVIKLYSYDVKDNQLFIRDMSPSIDQYLHNPALPFIVVESERRYKRDRGYTRTNFGLRRKLEKSEYVEVYFSQEIKRKDIGKLSVAVYVFKAKVDGKTAKKTKETIENEFFKNRMQVLFSVDGQVHGHLTSEFITRTLRFNLLRDYLLIHVDCTELNYNFRRELFMASRDRLKQSEETSALRKILGDRLKSGQLKDIHKQRKDRLPYDSAEDDALLKEVAENLPFSRELRKLFKQTLMLDEKSEPPKPKPRPPKPEPPPFSARRYPTFFNIAVKSAGGMPVIAIPLGGSRAVEFLTDVENHYFDRSEDPGSMDVTVRSHTPKDRGGGKKSGAGAGSDVADAFSVTKSSPQDGKIRVGFEPAGELQVGDALEMCVSLSSPEAADGHFAQVFLIKIANAKPKPTPKPKPPEEDEHLGLPRLMRVFQNADASRGGGRTWEQLEKVIVMDHSVIMYPYVDGDALDTIYVNMDSAVLKKYKSSIRGLEQNRLADRRYLSAVYFHTLFLYVINKQKNFEIWKKEKDLDLAEYLQELFQAHYAEFLLNFETDALMDALG